MKQQFKADIDQGLSRAQKTLPSKYFYDEVGDKLFVQIMEMPEYYLTRSELEIFKTQTNKIIDCLALDNNQYFELIELGAGDGTKTKELLNALDKGNYKFDYIPVDISQNALDLLSADLKSMLPNINVTPRQGDYFEVLETLKTSNHPKVILFLGSNIGNLNDKDAAKFIYQLGSNLMPNDKLLLGVDLKKSAEIILPAYNDETGITKAFNLNLLNRINKELDADFDLNNFTHSPEYKEDEGVALSYIESTKDQTVKINGAKEYQFKKGEKIHTEISRKYDDDVIAAILADTDFSVKIKLTDSKSYFADYILNRN